MAAGQPVQLGAGEPACLGLDAPRPIPAACELAVLLSGPSKLQGALAEREVDTTRIEARFTCRLAGHYLLQVKEKQSERIVLERSVVVMPGSLHVGSCELLAKSGRESRVYRLQAKDAHGNLHTTGGAQLAAAINQSSCVVHDYMDGTYAIAVPASAPYGPQVLRLWRRDRQEYEGEARFPVYVPRTRSEPESCRLLGAAEARSGRPVTLSLLLLDASGKRCTAGEVAAVEMHASLGGRRMVLSPAEPREGVAADERPQLLAVATPHVAGELDLRVWRTHRPGTDESVDWLAARPVQLLRTNVRVVSRECVACCAKRSTASGAALTEVRAGELGVIALSLRDVEGAPFTRAEEVALVLKDAAGKRIEGTEAMLEQELCALGDGRYDLQYREPHAARYLLFIQVSYADSSEGMRRETIGERAEVGKASRRPSVGLPPRRNDPLPAFQQTTLGPWELKVTPRALNLGATLQRAALPAALTAGRPLTCEMTLTDMYGNHLASMPPGLSLAAALERATGRSKATESGKPEARWAVSSADAPSASDLEHPEALTIIECECYFDSNPPVLHLSVPAMISGRWHVSVRCSGALDGLEGARYARSEVALNVEPGSLDASLCEAIGPGLRRAFLGRAANFVIRSRDGRGIVRKMTRGSPFRLSLLNAAGSIDSRVDQQSDGSFAVTYVPFGLPGVYMLSVTFAGKPICGSPFRVAVAELQNATRKQKLPRPSTAPAISMDSTSRRARRGSLDLLAQTREATEPTRVRGTRPTDHPAGRQLVRSKTAQMAASLAAAVESPSKGANLLLHTGSIDESIRALEAVSSVTRKPLRPFSATTHPKDEASAGASARAAGEYGNVGVHGTTGSLRFSYCRSLGIFMPSSASMASLDCEELPSDLLLEALEDQFHKNTLEGNFSEGSAVQPLVV